MVPLLWGSLYRLCVEKTKRDWGEMAVNLRLNKQIRPLHNGGGGGSLLNPYGLIIT
jgi:hypothetical protein